MTSGSTYENRSNLAPSFFAKIIAKYEGTRLGRQEIYAHILEDVPGALWERTNIDQHRVKEAPELRRIVVAVDPAVTNSEESDETGIVVVGIGADRHAYILADLSIKESPDGWARRAVMAYHSFEADRIIAEVNNGGDLVQHVVRTVDESVSFKAVRASRGKLIRAEPVAALYEQGKVHHVGMLGLLEDQLCSYVGGGKSPDRLDALVWGLTETMLGASFLDDALDLNAFKAGLRGGTVP